MGLFNFPGYRIISTPAAGKQVPSNRGQMYLAAGSWYVQITAAGTPGVNAGFRLADLVTNNIMPMIYPGDGGALRPPMHFEMQAEVQNVRFRMDGVMPTAAIGEILYSTTPGIPRPIFNWNAYSGSLDSPGLGPTVALAGAGAGNVDNGTHVYVVTFVGGGGETLPSTVSNVVTVADHTVNGQVSLTVIPLGQSGVSARKVYRSKAGTSSPFFLQSTIADNTTTTLTDNTADASLTTALGNSNTTSMALANYCWISATAGAIMNFHFFEE